MTDETLRCDAFIGLGGNVGDVLRTFGEALRRLEARDVVPAAVSRAYRTEALVPDHWEGDRVDFWNAVCAVRTDLSSTELLQVLFDVEKSLGRVRGSRWGPRPIDLDLISYRDEVRDTRWLKLPHPEVAVRLFVLRPLADLDAQRRLPSFDLTVEELISQHADPDAGILEVRESWLGGE